MRKQSVVSIPAAEIRLRRRGSRLLASFRRLARWRGLLKTLAVVAVVVLGFECSGPVHHIDGTVVARLEHTTTQLEGRHYGLETVDYTVRKSWIRLPDRTLEWASTAFAEGTKVHVAYRVGRLSGRYRITTVEKLTATEKPADDRDVRSARAAAVRAWRDGDVPAVAAPSAPTAGAPRDQ